MAADKTIFGEILDTEHVRVLRTYIEKWPRAGNPPEKVLNVVAEPDNQAKCRCPECGAKGVPVECVSADGAEWIHDVLKEKVPQAVICLDALHAVTWAT